MDRSPHILLLLAGGEGNRMKGDCPKQFREVSGKPVIAYSLRTFQMHPGIDKIYVVCKPEWSDFVAQTIKKEGITKFVAALPAGVLSIDSIRNGMAGIRRDYPDENPMVMLHEAARPLVSYEIISNNIATFELKGNAITAIRSHEAYMVSDDGESSVGCIPREQLFRAQTPQTFSLQEIEEAIAETADSEGSPHQSLYTMMASRAGSRPIYISPGDDLNFKLTVSDDLKLMKALLLIGG